VGQVESVSHTRNDKLFSPLTSIVISHYLRIEVNYSYEQHSQFTIYWGSFYMHHKLYIIVWYNSLTLFDQILAWASKCWLVHHSSLWSIDNVLHHTSLTPAATTYLLQIIGVVDLRPEQIRTNFEPDITQTN
jgi:hypothetical protein